MLLQFATGRFPLTPNTQLLHSSLHGSNSKLRTSSGKPATASASHPGTRAVGCGRLAPPVRRSAPAPSLATGATPNACEGGNVPLARQFACTAAYFAFDSVRGKNAV